MDKEMTEDPNGGIDMLRTVIATTVDFGTTRDERGTRLTYTYKSLTDTAAKYGYELAGARVVFAAMRELGFERVNGGVGGTRYSIDLKALLLLTLAATKEWTDAAIEARAAR